MADTPLIDPSLLAGLSESERAEALAAAEAAQRAEKRAEERAKQRKLAQNNDTSNVNGNTNGGTAALSEEQEEQRALAEAQERRIRERQRERELDLERRRVMGGGNSRKTSSNLDGGSNTTSSGGGLVFVSKRKRGTGQISSDTATTGDASTSVSLAASKSRKVDNSQISNNNNSSQQSHLTASQLASIKKAYLGEKTVKNETTAASSYDNSSSRNGQGSNTNASIRQRLREQRQKRRVKKTVFKFEWDGNEDTFEDDDPLYGGTMRKDSSNNRYNGRYQQSSPRNGSSSSGGISRPPQSYTAKQQLQQDDIKFGKGNKKKKSKNYDTVTSVHTVSTKPLDKMTNRDWRIYRENYNIVVKGGKSPPPLRSFREVPKGIPPIHPSLLNAIENKLKYTNPSPIQRQAIPIGMQRRDLIGIAETGSGKTASFGIPLCHHVMMFPQSILDTVDEEGPLALVMAPTRELALQINVEFGKLLSSQSNIVSFAVVGGQSITEQATKIRTGVHIVVGTPGRINDCIEMTYLVLNQCSYIVLDEVCHYIIAMFVRCCMIFCSHNVHFLFVTATPG